ncbi:MAG: hypothetical protein AAGC44_03290 [Planctomycetota bacterium]
MARRVTTGLIFGVLVVLAGLSSRALADEPVTLDQAVVAMQQLDAESTRSDVWNRLQDLSNAIEHLDRHEPSRDDPAQALLSALAEDHLPTLVNAYARFVPLRYYLRPLVEEAILRNGGPDLARLDTVVLPENATEQQAWVYIRDIVRTTQGQRRISSNDPQVDMLVELGKDHMPLLLQTLEMSSLQYYALAAVRKAANDTHKDLIIEALREHEQLIMVIQRNGWAADARDQIMLGLHEGINYTPRVWVQALAELKDPATYDTLVLQLYRVRCSKYYYLVVKDLPGIDLRPAVFASWEAVHTSPTHARELREVSQIAVSYGHRGALAHLVSLLPTEPPAHPGRAAEIRRAILDHITFEGTDDQVRDWFEENEHRLRFSESIGRFYVAGGLH